MAKTKINLMAYESVIVEILHISLKEPVADVINDNLRRNSPIENAPEFR